MFYCPNKYKKEFINVNDKLKQLQGELDEKEARLTLVDFLRSNIGFTVELLTGIKLYPVQEIILKGMMMRDRTMCLLGRGSGKSFIAGIFSILQCIFEPGTKIMLAGPTFRTSRFIFTYLEKIIKSPRAELLMQAFNNQPSKRNDMFSWEINGGSISAIPLNGQLIRGFRANILLIDEYLLMPKNIIDDVLMPFLSSPLDLTERIEIRELEDRLIADGALREDQRIKFENNSKMIAFSSASYTFENLYLTYQDWKNKIYAPEDGTKDKDDNKYFIAQLAYDAFPEYSIDKSVINEANSGGSSKASFQREYCAQFVDESDGFFSAKMMNECTLKEGEEPTTMISGRPGKKYILSIDPSFSKSKTSDFFAMAIMELDEENRDSILVHGYAKAGGDLKNHISYLHYLLTNFKIEMIIIDNAGWGFIEAANESELFKKNKINLGFLDVNTDLVEQEYSKMLQQVKSQYSLENGKICFKQVPSVEFIRRSGQHLQYCINYKKVWFASYVRANAAAFERAINTFIDMKTMPFDTVADLIEFQDDLIYQTKTQCSLIEVSTTSKGTQSFDLPRHLLVDQTEKRARKDNYTALLLGNWAVKLYYDLHEVKPVSSETFVPFFGNSRFS